jgi:putative acetyltransferase
VSEIRSAQQADYPAIETVHRSAFSTDLEARLVRLLVARGQDAISLVAVTDGQVVGHVLFSPATIDIEGCVIVSGLGLAPVAVLPPFQNRGHGSALICAGLEGCSQLAVPFVVVLGEPTYYSRFGFVPASRYGLSGEFGGDDAFQIQWMAKPTELPAGCVVRYAAGFREILGAASE